MENKVWILLGLGLIVTLTGSGNEAVLQEYFHVDSSPSPVCESRDFVETISFT
jgi:hypothetical protein